MACVESECMLIMYYTNVRLFSIRYEIEFIYHDFVITQLGPSSCTGRLLCVKIEIGGVDFNGRGAC